jgi:hypothetical protein
VSLARPPSPNNLSTSPGTSSSPVAFLSLILLIAFSTGRDYPGKVINNVVVFPVYNFLN